jgi:uncharacterized membrane-anchored protein
MLSGGITRRSTAQAPYAAAQDFEQSIQRLANVDMSRNRALIVLGHSLVIVCAAFHLQRFAQKWTFMLRERDVKSATSPG